MWTIVELDDLICVLLWDGEIMFDIFWNLDEAVERLQNWYAGH